MSSSPNTNSFGISDTGLVREQNEDQFLIADLSKSMIVRSTSIDIPEEARLFGASGGQLMLVADGIGGNVGGKRASALTVNTVANHVLNTMPWFLQMHYQYEDELLDQLKLAVTKCETVVEADIDEHPDRLGMGTTLTLAYVLWPRMYVVHVGDSRCYVLRATGLEQITRDHTMAQLLKDEGFLTEEYRQARFGHVLVNSIGHGQERLFPEVYKTELHVGDTILLCTDGLYGQLSDERTADILDSSQSEREACRALVCAAKRAGGRDNITAIVSKY